jgi:hypothetical protein
MNRFFHVYIEPSLQSLPVLRVAHAEIHNGREFRISQTVCRNVYTDFDRCLSRNLAATGGEAFPAFTVNVEVAEARDGGEEHHLVSGFHDSVPHALMELAERANERAGTVELAFYRSALKKGHESSVAQRRSVGPHEVEALRSALAICRSLGDPEFMDISGDFSLVVAQPPGNLDPVLLHLSHGTVAFPSGTTTGSSPFQWPLYTYADHASTNLAAQGYLAAVGNALLREKSGAIREFREAAERRVIDFHRALDGRAPQGHWLEGAQALLARLRAGLGDALVGISEDTRGIALDLARMVEGDANASGLRLARGEGGSRPIVVV